LVTGEGVGISNVYANINLESILLVALRLALPSKGLDAYRSRILHEI
jgi:hypothetical protein